MHTRLSFPVPRHWALLALLLPIVGCQDDLIGPDGGYAGSDQANHPPAAPTALRITVLDPATVSLSWQDNADDEDGFRVYRGTSTDRLALVGALEQDVAIARDSGLTPLTTYYYQVVAFNADGESAPATDSITTPGDASRCTSPDTARRVLVDASKDGGVWWFPQGDRFDPDAPHQGRALAEQLRCLGYVVTELGRGTRVTDSLLSVHRIVIRANRFGPAYTDGEIAAYREFLARPTTLVLLSDHQTYTDGEDEVADLVGVGFVGSSGDEWLTAFAEHPITEGVSGVRYLVGAYAVAKDPSVVSFLGWLPGGQPVMGISQATAAKVFFLGDTNLLESLPQPLLDNLIRWGF